MLENEASEIFNTIESYGGNPSDGYEVEVYSRSSLRKFHQWADGKPSFGTLKVKAPEGNPYFLVFCKWSEKNEENYYMIIFPLSRVGPIAEIWKVEEGNLIWEYAPRKRGNETDGPKIINDNLKKAFIREYGQIEAQIQIPENSSEVEQFLNEIIRLDAARQKVENEIKNNPNVSGEVAPNINIWLEKTICEDRPDRLSGEYSLGNALWSPQKSGGGANIYKNMRLVKPGDIVIHFVDNKGIQGLSIVKSKYDDQFIGLENTEWNSRPGYLVKLRNYVDLAPFLDRKNFLGDPNYRSELKKIRNNYRDLFYQDDLNLRQGAYLTPAPIPLFKLFNQSYKNLSGANLPFFEMINQPRESPDDGETKPMDIDFPLNLILYGPPGTGKTYQAVNRALEIIDPTFLEENLADRSKIKARFDELRDEERISFVTFHQSFSYEDFVEGIKANSNENGQIYYDIEDGIFKRVCETASSTVEKSSAMRASLEGKRIWKMSLGNTLGEDAYIYDECIQNNYILMGYGRGIDFSGRKTREDILKAYTESGDNKNIDDYDISAIYRFISMKAGDIFVVSDGNHKFRAIGEVKNSVRLLDDVDRDTYLQCRDVNWIRVYNPSRSKEELFDKSLSQQTIYELKPSTIRIDALARLLKDEGNGKGQKPYVLIIDEINRGNISRIFGELITLIETSKRAGSAESLSVRLPYSKTRFSVPNNLYILGTMNTADRSLALMDTALRRRFTFEELMPDPDSLKGLEIEGINLSQMLKAMNDRIELLYDREHTLGHTYFLPLKENNSIGLLAEIFRRQVLPLLQEYFFEDWEKIRLVLSDPNKPKGLAFVVHKFSENEKSNLFDQEHEDLVLQSAYTLNLPAFINPDSYKSIYQPKKDE